MDISRESRQPREMETFIDNVKRTVLAALPSLAFISLLLAALGSIPQIIDASDSWSARQLIVIPFMLAPVLFVYVRREASAAALLLGAFLQLGFMYESGTTQNEIIATWVVALVFVLVPHNGLRPDVQLVRKFGIAAIVWAALVIIVALTTKTSDSLQYVSTDLWSTANLIQVFDVVVVVVGVLMLVKRPLVALSIALPMFLTSLAVVFVEAVNMVDNSSILFSIEYFVLRIMFGASLVVVAVNLAVSQLDRAQPEVIDS